MTWTVEQHQQFAALAHQVLKSNVPGFAALDGESHDESLEVWTMALWAFKPEIEQVEPAAAAGQLESFARLLVPWDMENRVKVSFKLGRNYGTEYVEFGLTDLSKPGEAAMKAGTDRLIKTVLSEHDDYAARHLARGGAQPAVGGERKQQPSSVMVDEGHFIDFEAKGGKRLYSIKAGRWQKFGIRIWPEALTAAGINEADIPFEGLEIGPTDVSYVMKPDGVYPDKVVKLDRRG